VYFVYFVVPELRTTKYTKHTKEMKNHRGYRELGAAIAATKTGRNIRGRMMKPWTESVQKYSRKGAKTQRISIPVKFEHPPCFEPRAVLLPLRLGVFA